MKVKEIYEALLFIAASIGFFWATYGIIRSSAYDLNSEEWKREDFTAVSGVLAALLLIIFLTLHFDILFNTSQLISNVLIRSFILAVEWSSFTLGIALLITFLACSIKKLMCSIKSRKKEANRMSKNKNLKESKEKSYAGK